MRRSLLAIFLAFSLIFAVFGAFGFSPAAYSEPDPDVFFSDEKVSGVTAYWYEEMHHYTEDEALAAGVPEGFAGDVLMLRSADGGHVGITFDVGGGRLLDIESITFRVWCPANTREFRITDNGGVDWIVRVVPEETEKWIDITIGSDGKNIYSGKSFKNLGDENGKLKPVNMGFRFTDSADSTVYIDATFIKWKPLDTEPPVISYNGETVIRTTAGQKLVIDATAYDEGDQATIRPYDYIYTAGAVDENELLLEGTHSCTVRFFDYRGNVAELVLTLIVEPQDVTPPALDWAPDAIYANVGMRPILDVTAEDDRAGELEPVLTWSDGALDARGRFLEGEHTLTITAVDPTGNKTEKVIPVKVTSGLPTVE